jgi:uncharacterized glyoxalase superfamily protein PhnB
MDSNEERNSSPEGMAMTDRAYVPADGRLLTPYIWCRDALKALDWYAEVLGARVVSDPIVDDAGLLGHAEIVDPFGVRWMIGTHVGEG